MGYNGVIKQNQEILLLLIHLLIAEEQLCVWGYDRNVCETIYQNVNSSYHSSSVWENIYPCYTFLCSFL